MIKMGLLKLGGVLDTRQGNAQGAGHDIAVFLR